MWTVAVFLATIACFYSIQSMFVDFFNYETLFRNEVISVEKMKFPQLVVCNMKENVTIRTLNSSLFNSKNSDRYVKMTTTYNRIGKTMQCLAFDSLNKNDPIKQEHFDSVFDGLQLTLNVSQHKEHLFFVYVLSSHSRPFYSYPNLLISKGTFHNIVVRYNSEKLLGKPYSECLNSVEQNEIVEETVKYNNVYEKSKCYFICRFRYFADRYNCTYPVLQETGIEENCYEKVNETTFLKFRDIEECSPVCPNECVTDYYTLSHQDTKDQENDDFITIFMSFRERKYLNLKEIPKTNIFDLISKIGGTLGFFIGCRLLSLFDILEFFLKFLFFILNKCCSFKDQRVADQN